MDPVVVTNERVRPLDPGECRQRLLQVGMGRVSITAGAIPLVVPVHFTVDGDAIVFAAVKGSGLHSASDGSVIAFQADAFDDAGAGWNVIVVGRAHHVRDDHLPPDLPVATWADGVDHDVVRYVRVEPGRILGHQVGTVGEAGDR